MKTMMIALLATALVGESAPFAAPRQIPTAPQAYLERKSPVAANDDAALAAGKKLYDRKCKRCHGEKGDGKGSSAKELTPSVTSFVAPGYLGGRKDGQLFWIIEKGSEGSDMDAFGEGTITGFSADDIWNIVAYMRSKFTKR